MEATKNSCNSLNTNSETKYERIRKIGIGSYVSVHC